MRSETAVLFDMDGVIFDSERACLSVWQELASQLGLEDIAQVFIRCIGTNKRRTAEIFREAYPLLDFAAFDAAVRARFLARYGEGRLPVKPGAEAILRTLHELGVPLALASSTERAVVERELREAGLLQYFDALTCGDQVRHSKPDPEIFLLAARSLGREPGNCYVIEDSFNGIRAAAAAGMHPIMVPDMLLPDGEMERLAQVILPDLDAALRYLREQG